MFNPYEPYAFPSGMSLFDTLSVRPGFITFFHRFQVPLTKVFTSAQCNASLLVLVRMLQSEVDPENWTVG